MPKWTNSDLDYIESARAAGVNWKAIGQHFGVADRTATEAYRRRRGAPPPYPKNLARPRQMIVNITEPVHSAVMAESMSTGKSMGQVVNDILETHFSQPQPESRPNGTHPNS